MMRRSAVLFVLLFLFYLPARAQLPPLGCMTCGCDVTWVGGWQKCMICVSPCSHGSPTMDLANTYDSGIRVVNTAGKFIIKAIVLHSPAAHARLQPGDHILEVDGISFAPEQKPTLESRLRSPILGSVTVKVRRANRELEFRLQREPLLAILNRAWLSQKGFHDPDAGARVLPFAAGFRLEVEGNSAYVRAILPRSPASLAGLKLGDEIVAVNGNAMVTLEAGELENALQGYRSKALRLGVKRADGMHEIVFNLPGLTQLVKSVLLPTGGKTSVK